MKLFLPAILVVALGCTVMAQTGNIEGSRHDLTDGTGPNSNYNLGATIGICEPCHAPHQPAQGGEGVLWNRELPVANTFTMFGATVADTAGTLTSGNTTASQPGAASLKCLSCHDGVTAIDNYGGTTTGSLVMETTLNQVPKALVGQNLSDDHPIGVAIPGTGDYSHDSTNLPLRDSGGTGGPGAGLSVECSTCHNPHGTWDGTSAYYPSFLRLDSAGSAICLGCHNL